MTPKTRLLSIFLIKDGFEADYLEKESHSPKVTPVRVGQVDCTLYTESSSVRTPSWVSFLAEGVDTSTLGPKAASASALLVVPMTNRTFAIAFGQGRYLLNPMAIEPTFGLKATLNAVAEDKIRSIDKKTFETISTHTQEQASKETSIGDFGLDIERDVVRAVSGTPSSTNLGKRLRGMDALTATCALSFNQLPEYLQDCYSKSQDDTYKQRFPWIDNILEVRDKARRGQLDEALVEQLQLGGNAKIWLAVPALIDWADH